MKKGSSIKDMKVSSLVNREEGLSKSQKRDIDRVVKQYQSAKPTPDIDKALSRITSSLAKKKVKKKARKKAY